MEAREKKLKGGSEGEESEGEWERGEERSEGKRRRKE